MKIVPITALRDTVKIDEEINKDKTPIIVTKNGYMDFVILPKELYETNLRQVEEDEYPKELIEALPSDPLGYVRIAMPDIEVSIANVSSNLALIKEKIISLKGSNPAIILFPELAISGYACGDLFLTHKLIDQASKAIESLRLFSKDIQSLIVIGAPLRKDGVLFDCQIYIYKGSILGVVPKTNLRNAGGFYEGRYFVEAESKNSFINIEGRFYPFGNKLLFRNVNYPSMIIGGEISSDLWMANPPSSYHSLKGASIILNSSSSNEVVEMDEYRRALVKTQSGRCNCIYAYASSGEGESTTDSVLSSHKLVGENGLIIKENELFSNQVLIIDVDLEKIDLEKIRKKTNQGSQGYKFIDFSLPLEEPKKIKRFYETNPFIPNKEIDLNRVSFILRTQAEGLIKRLKTVHQNKVVLGLSGGLDSTLALLVCKEAFTLLGYDPKEIHAITMPAFGTSKRTHDNALKLATSLGVSFKEIKIKESVIQHLKDIEHDIDNHNVAYENAQARERTQLLMDYANDIGALMIGTGDLSELCLGWCTYNGDHMSMYAVNGSIPKTLVRYLCEGYTKLHPETKESIMDIIDTPISPELLPTKDGKISQKTEDLIGPYELHDFFIYHFLRYGYRPRKLLKMAINAFIGRYDEETIRKWLKVFLKKFFQSQFKRSALPDGAGVGSVDISPRSGLKMPSDADVSDYLKDLE